MKRCGAHRGGRGGSWGGGRWRVLKGVCRDKWGVSPVAHPLARQVKYSDGDCEQLSGRELRTLLKQPESVDQPQSEGISEEKTQMACPRCLKVPINALNQFCSSNFAVFLLHFFIRTAVPLS